MLVRFSECRLKSSLLLAGLGTELTRDPQKGSWSDVWPHRSTQGRRGVCMSSLTIELDSDKGPPKGNGTSPT